MSVRCTKCSLFNSFSFLTNQTRCIKCNTLLNDSEIQSSKMYQENIKNKTFKSSWYDVEDINLKDYKGKN